MSIIPRPKASITTLYLAEVQFVFKQSHLHDSDYTMGVIDKIDAAIKTICDDLDVINDDQYRCQCEGARLMGTDLKSVQEAGKRLERVLKRFKFIEHIDLDAL